VLGWELNVGTGKRKWIGVFIKETVHELG